MSKYKPLSDEAKLRLCQTKTSDNGRIDPSEYVYSTDHPANAMCDHLGADIPRSDLGRHSRGLRRLIARQHRLTAAEILVVECLIDQAIDFKPTQSQIAYLVGCLEPRGVEEAITRLCARALMKKQAETIAGTLMRKNVYDLSPLGNLLHEALREEAKRKAALVPKRAKKPEGNGGEVVALSMEPPRSRPPSDLG